MRNKSEAAQIRAFFLSCSYYSSVALLAWFILSAGAVPQRLFAQDTFLYLSGGWKMFQGHLPFQDYDVDTGLLPLIFVGMGEWATGGTTLALPLSVVFPLVPLTIAIWYINRDRFNRFLALLISGYLILLWSTPLALHFPFLFSTYSMYYNRESYVFLSLIVILLTASVQKNVSTNKYVYFTIGVLLGLLFFLKITYFVAAIWIVLGLSWNSEKTSKNYALILFGIVTTILPFIIYIGPSGLSEMLSVYHRIGQTRSWSFLDGGIILLAYELPAFLLLFTVLFWGLERKMRRKYGIEFAVVFVGAAIAETGGCPWFVFIDVPLLTVYAMILLSRYSDGELGKIRKLEVSASALILLIVPSFGNLFLGVIYSLIFPNLYSTNLVSSIDAAPCPMLVENTYKEGFPGYADLVNDGLNLLRNSKIGDQPLATLSFSDPFCFCLHHAPARHMPTLPLFGFNLNRDIYLPPDYIFQDAGYIMEVTHLSTSFKDYHPYLRLEVPAYAKFMAKNFKPVGHSKWWVLWERNSLIAPPTAPSAPETALSSSRHPLGQ